jgi:hypothetical protein
MISFFPFLLRLKKSAIVFLNKKQFIEYVLSGIRLILHNKPRAITFSEHGIQILNAEYNLTVIHHLAIVFTDLLFVLVLELEIYLGQLLN